MTTDGWEQRLDDLGQAREDSAAATEDVRAIAVALGLGGHARPYSAHEVVRREILPALAPLLAAQAAVERVEALATELDIEARGRWLRVLDARTADERDAEFGERGAGDALHDAAIRIRRAVDGCPP